MDGTGRDVLVLMLLLKHQPLAPTAVLKTPGGKVCPFTFMNHRERMQSAFICNVQQKGFASCACLQLFHAAAECAHMPNPSTLLLSSKQKCPLCEAMVVSRHTQSPDRQSLGISYTKQSRLGTIQVPAGMGTLWHSHWYHWVCSGQPIS